ncbi:LEA type 2 family protein [Simiduia sp. 21SJ11W-1]|uniref:LEA type 2 family protein n=1 Tax=Simiduia sp. 21SJ11W-1 TaxID=2909669 RepID=UPI00209F9046|nr:LEA type 2 family protein [Simiduia sp. 21SJ11W-1]UTA47756.1 LEA type 2 family protein [Simiduia sp. 21SJ11W-1]
MKGFAQWLILVVVLSGCAGIQPGLEAPEVKLVSVQPITSDGFHHRFAVGLAVTNPNATDISVRGMSYRIGIAGHDIFSGVANQVPVLPAYAETPVTVEVSASLMNVLALISDLSSRSPSELTYQLNAKLDVGTFMPAIRVEESGPLPFTQLRLQSR